MIISQIEHVQEYTNATLSVNIHSLLPLLPTVMATFIKPVVPNALLDKLDDLTEPNADATDTYAVLLFKLRGAIAPLLVANYLPRGAVSLGETGLQRHETETEKTAFRYQQTAFNQSYLTSGLAALEEFLAYCHSHTNDISEWKDSEQHKAYKALLIKSGTELNSYYNFKHPQLMYAQLLTDMQDVELIMFRKEFGSNYAKLIAKTAPSDTETELLQTLKKALVYLAYARFIPKSSLGIDSEGIFASTADDQYHKNTTSASALAISKLQENTNATASEYFALAKTQFSTLIATNADYTSVEVKEYGKINNSASKGAFML